MTATNRQNRASWGRIVITDLYNYAIPLIRYDNGDLAVAERRGEERQIPSLSQRTVRTPGRYDLRHKRQDRFSLRASQRAFHGKRDQPVPFHQEDIRKYTLWLNGEKEEIDEKAILDFIRPYFGEDAEITVEYLDEIPVLNSGKRKSFENRCEKYAVKPGAKA